MPPPYVVQGTPRDKLKLGGEVTQSIGDHVIYVPEDTGDIRFYGRLYVNDVEIDDITGIVGPPGPIGPPGAGGPFIYEHTQGSASTTWTINHNLNETPLTVQTFNAGGIQIFGAVQHTSVNQTVVSFNSAQSGSARIV